MRSPQAIATPGIPQAHGVLDFADPESDGADICWYVISPGADGGSTLPQPATVQIDAGVDFYWYATSLMVSDGNDASQTLYSTVNPLINVILTDVSSGKNLQNIKFPLPLIAGISGYAPYYLIQPRVLRSNTVVSGSFSYLNPAAPAAYDFVYLVLHGYTRPAV